MISATLVSTANMSSVFPSPQSSEMIRSSGIFDELNSSVLINDRNFLPKKVSELLSLFGLAETEWPMLNDSSAKR